MHRKRVPKGISRLYVFNISFFFNVDSCSLVEWVSEWVSVVVRLGCVGRTTLSNSQCTIVNLLSLREHFLSEIIVAHRGFRPQKVVLFVNIKSEPSIVNKRRLIVLLKILFWNWFYNFTLAFSQLKWYVFRLTL